MRTRILGAAVLATALVSTSCTTGSDTVAPSVTALPVTANLAAPPVRISEIHYDNTGTDAGEAIEVSAPAGTDLTGWSLVLYNGSPTSRATYGTSPLTGTVPATCGARGVVVVNYAVNGIQNGGSGATGEPDGVALVNASGTVVEFLSYEGSFTAANGPASGMTSTSIGVFEAGTEPLGQSLQRSGADVWSGPITATFGACNTGENDTDGPVVASVTVTPASASLVVGGATQYSATAYDASNTPIAGAALTWSVSDAAVASVTASGVVTALGAGDAQVTARAANNVSGSASVHVDPLPPTTNADVRISEIHYDNTGTDVGEAIEVSAPAGTNLAGYSLALYNGDAPQRSVYATTPLSGTVAATCGARGVLTFTYPSNGIQNGPPDGVALVGPSGVIEFLSYEGSFVAASGPAAGMTSVDIGVSEAGTEAVGQSLQRRSDGTWYGPATSSFGACNVDTPPPPPENVFFTGRTPSDAPLPVGYEDQLFGNLTVGGTATTTTWTYASETPAIATIDQNGVMRALAAGTAVIRATAATGATGTISLPTIVATPGGTAQYGHNVEFGIPVDNTPGDDFLITRDEYTTSWNAARSTPNWVSYDIDATHIGTQDRCDCFTYDPELPANAKITTADYTGAGAFHGYGIDRGHLARSFDRSTGSLDNAHTFYFSNIIPQASDNNQGPWAAFETYLGDQARFQNKEVFVVAGASGSKGTLKNEGRIVIPSVTWKVAVIMNRDQGLADVHTAADVQVIAVMLPNDAGIRNVPWQTFQTTVDMVEATSGYDLLRLLRDDIEIQVESNTKPPVAAVDGPYTSLEGASVALSGASSTDPDAGQTLTFAWSFGDGATASGATTSHTYAQDGSYTVRLIVTDPLGLADTVTTTTTVANVTPTIAAVSGATIMPGETYTASGAFTDPGADGWTATVDYGDGSGAQVLALGGKSFALSHAYATAGTYTVTVRVSDDDATASGTATVTVLTQVAAVTNAIALVEALRSGGALNDGQTNSFLAKLRTAKKQFEVGDAATAVNSLTALLNQIDDYVSSGTLSTADAAPLRAYVQRIIESARSGGAVISRR